MNMLIKNLDHPRWGHGLAERGHYLLYRTRGRAVSCAWGCIAAKYQWANLTGDYMNPDDYAQMCITCHRRFDAAQERMIYGTALRGARHHPLVRP